MNLSQHFLIGMPSINDPIFHRSVVYVYTHSPNGAIGVIINTPIPVGLDMVLPLSGSLPERFKNRFFMLGGPVQTQNSFALHTPAGQWKHSLIINENLAITSSSDIVEHLGDTAENIHEIMLFAGYCHWESGQLENEIRQNFWLTVPADNTILFHTAPEHRHHAALAKLGIRPEQLIGSTAHV